MGEGILNFYRTKIKKEYKIAFFATLILALLIHIYKFTNTLPNHDSVYNYYSDQNVLGSGRWALSLACGISSYFDLPWVNGFLSCIFIALTVAVIVALFQIKNPVVIALTGGLLAASPATTETLFFLFTADGYMLAMLLAALAVWFSRIEEKRKTRHALSAVCICVACGIYQAYVSFALILAVCYLIDVLLQNKHDKRECLKWILRQAILYIAALAAYYLIWKLCMYVTGIAANTYQGISEVGAINLSTLIGGISRSIHSVLLFFLQWDIIEHGLTLYSVLNLLFLLTMAVGLIIACVKIHIFKRKWAIVLLAICLIAIIPFSCIWHFTSDSVGYRAMMLQCLTLLFILTALIYEKWTGVTLKNLLCCLLIVIIFNQGLMANISYYYMNLCYERTYADGMEMMLKIHDLQNEHDLKQIAVIGDRLDDVQWFEKDIANTAPSGNIHMLSYLLETNLLFNSEHTIPYLHATFGLDIPAADKATCDKLAQMPDVQKMGCWPAGDSITVKDNILIIKLADVSVL